jgi:rubrerythrin
MSEEAFETNSGCESSSHTQHLCYIISQGFNLSNESEFAELIKDPQFKCQKCGRLAKEKINLCKPVKFSPGQRDGRERLRNRMMKLRSVSELLDAVIMQEIRAQELYMKMALMVENSWMRNVLECFAKEELRHKQKLEAVKADKISLEQINSDDLEFGDTFENTKPHAGMDYPELLAYAIKKEKSSYQLYTSIAAALSEPELKDTFLKLAQQEANHMQRLKFEYDQVKPR